jgi:hypothetical protein
MKPTEQPTSGVIEVARAVARVVIGFHPRYGKVVLEDDGSRRPVFLLGLRPENNRPVQYDDGETVVVVGRPDGSR